MGATNVVGIPVGRRSFLEGLDNGCLRDELEWVRRGLAIHTPEAHRSLRARVAREALLESERFVLIVMGERGMEVS